MKLKALSLTDCEQVRQWRNEQTEMLRTPFLLTQEQQEQFYHNVVCNRQANARYWSMWKNVLTEYESYYPNMSRKERKEMPKTKTKSDKLIGMCGLENICWENRNAEISLIFNSEYSMDEYGEEALKLLLYEGFMNMSLENIYAEVYECNPCLRFWESVYSRYNGSLNMSILPERKYYNGKFYNSIYVNINKGAFLRYENTFSKPAYTPD